MMLHLERGIIEEKKVLKPLWEIACSGRKVELTIKVVIIMRSPIVKNIIKNMMLSVP